MWIRQKVQVLLRKNYDALIPFAQRNSRFIYPTGLSEVATRFECAWFNFAKINFFPAKFAIRFDQR
jgi:hypothetical protein